ncbi:uncharacterized protein LOC108459270 [Gossypium arboreum]|uniref:uncharacterized protein LOC108459270 n=1 Tax=Gossypium arboreum TaxID=29729 RepID=UPI00081978A9|nr:uncharacterized protein LOC108459270 [Gossypium arboreum]
MADRSFMVDWKKGSDSAYTVALYESKLWLKRLGHTNYRSLYLMTKENLVENFSKTVEKEEVCEVCCKLKTLRSNNGTEYTSSRFQGFCDEAARLRVFGYTSYAYVPAVKRDKDVVFDKKSSRNWDKNKPKITVEDLVTDHTEANQNDAEMDIGDMPVRGTRPLAEIYARTDVAIVEPCFFEEAEAHQGWKQAMLDEMSMIEKNQIWQLVARLDKKKVIRVKWVFRAKHNIDGTLNKLKTRLVVKGFSQKYGIDYFETFSPVARLDTIRLLVALAAHKQWKIHQIDVKSAFLNGFLDEEIYVEQPEGFKIVGE